MDVLAEDPLRADTLVYLSPGGEETLALIVKATFQLAPGESPLINAEPEAVFGFDLRWDDDPQASLRRASDLVPFKRSPEVVLVGSAYTAESGLQRSVRARLAIAEVDKVIEVHGDRHFELDGSLSEAKRFSTMPLRWERAAGGLDSANPVGVPPGPEAVPDAWGRRAVPNLWPSGAAISDPNDSIAAVGFGPIAADWPERRARLHRHAATWMDRGWTRRPLPHDFDSAYFNVAPSDQRLADLSGEESLLLEHLHPLFTRLSTRLARISPGATLVDGARAAVPIPLACDTLSIHTDRATATLVFRGRVPLAHASPEARIIVSLQQAVIAPVPSSRLGTLVLDLSQPAALPVLPFRPSETARVGRSALGRSMRLEAPDENQRVEATAGGGAIPEPDASDDEDHSDEEITADELPEDLETTAALSAEDDGLDSLPFANTDALPRIGIRIRPAEPLTPIAPVAPIAPIASLTPVAPITPIAPLAAAIAPAPPEGASATLGQRLAGDALSQVLLARPSSENAAPLTFVPPPTSPLEPPVPPPLIGPVAVAALLESGGEAAEAPPEPGPTGPVLADYPLERCAAIRASLDLLPFERARILESESLDEESWERFEHHWSTVIERELSRRQVGLIRAQDAAYLARIEERRGPITGLDYARLYAAAEVGELAPVLHEMALPEGAWPRLKRLWVAKGAKDPKLAAMVKDLIERELGS